MQICVRGPDLPIDELLTSSKPNDHQAVLFAQNGLIDMPTRAQMGQDDGTHFALLFGVL